MATRRKTKKLEGHFRDKVLKQSSFSRTTLIFFAAIFAAIGVYLLLHSFAQAPLDDQPNIVFIITDDEPALDGRLIDHLPTMRSVFKEQGVTFSDFHPSTAWCCPSRASYLTGQYVHNHGVDRNDYLPLNPSMTIATQLQSVDYHTILAGKYLNGYGGCDSEHPCPPPTPPGWDHFAAIGGRGNDSYYGYDLWIDGNPIPEKHEMKADDYSTDVVAKKSVQWIEQAPTDKPLFAWIAPFNPHGPTTPAPRHQGSNCSPGVWSPPNWNEADLSDKPEWLKRIPSLNEPTDLTRHCRNLLSVDDLIQNVRDALSRTGRLDNTLLIYGVDNSLQMGEHRLTKKSAPYQTHTPFYISWPAQLGSAPRSISERVASIDVTATLCEVAGCTLGPYPNGQPSPDGKSFLGLLLETETDLGRDAMLEEMPAGGNAGSGIEVPPWYAVVTTSLSPLARQVCAQSEQGDCRWHYIEYDTGEKELYDISGGPCWNWRVGQQGDPCELDNQVNNPLFAAVRSALATRLEQLKTGVGNEPSISLEALPTEVEAGQTSILTWTTRDVSDCRTSDNWNNPGTRDLNGSESTPPLNQTTTFTLTCKDLNNNEFSDSATVSVKEAEDTRPPAVSMKAPDPGSEVSGSNVTVSAEAVDNEDEGEGSGVAGVQFKLDGNNLAAEDTTHPYSIVWDTLPQADGPHSLTAEARDNAGNTKTAEPISITVKNKSEEPPPPPPPEQENEPPAKRSDINDDNEVNIYDLSILLSNYGKTGSGNKSDINRDGVVNIYDLSTLLSNYGRRVE